MKDRKKEIEEWLNKRKYFNEEKEIKEEENTLNRKKLVLILEKIRDQQEILKEAETNKNYKDYQKASDKIDLLRKELFMIHSMAIITEFGKVVYNKDMITEFIVHLLLTFDHSYILEISREIERLSGNNISINCKDTNDLSMSHYSGIFKSLKPFFDQEKNNLPIFRPFKMPVEEVLEQLRVECSQIQSNTKNCKLLPILKLLEVTKQSLNLTDLQLLEVFLFQSKNKFKYFLGSNLTSNETEIYCIDKAGSKPSYRFFLDREEGLNKRIYNIKLSCSSNKLIHSEDLKDLLVKKFDDLNNSSISLDKRFSLYKEILKELNSIIIKIIRRINRQKGSNKCSVCEKRYNKPPGYKRKNYCPNCNELSTLISNLTKAKKDSVERSLKSKGHEYCKDLLINKNPTFTEQETLKKLYEKSFNISR